VAFGQPGDIEDVEVGAHVALPHRASGQRWAELVRKFASCRRDQDEFFGRPAREQPNEGAYGAHSQIAADADRKLFHRSAFGLDREQVDESLSRVVACSVPGVDDR
jgi:hypothetical protein